MLAVIGLALALAACSGGPGDASSVAADESPPTATAGTPTPGGLTSPTSTSSPTGEPAPSALVGVWTIQLQDKLRALLEPYGGIPSGLSCQGAENLLFEADGGFLATLAGRCRFLGKNGTVDGGQAGWYRDEGDAFVLIDVTGNVTGEIKGVPVPLAFWDRVTGAVPYRVSGEELTIEVSMPGGSTIELTYRAA